ncbi:hypothetical protein [Opitutus sp. ER46]|uniref:hypothetical protein n=1 Tax=Opitutus sp. ER46 TaxID=2161864 RepID=UPI0011B27983|nr:hypothetical protein [Opitutus sp. ER46]
MKKNNAKTKSPAPATRSTKTAKKKSAGMDPQTIDSLTAALAQPAASEVKTAAPSVKAVPPAPVFTKIVARIDVGFGNALYVRGDGPGLSWNQGVRMECVSSDQWELILGEFARPISFKLLLNDMTWCTGPDSVVASGSTVTLTPEFA